MRRRLPVGGRWLAALVAAALSATTAQGAPPPPAEAGLFDQLFGNDPAAERAGAASDGLALPGLYADGQRLSDAIAMHDLGPDAGACVAITPLLDALELDHQADASGDIRITLPEPRRIILLPASALLPSPNGQCLPLAAASAHLPLALSHDPASQRLLLKAQAPLPVLMRLARAERQARLHPEAARPTFALQPRPSAKAQLWSADLAVGLQHDTGRSDASASMLVSGEILGLGARASLGLASRGAPTAGFTVSEARDTPDLLGPLHARSLAAGDIGTPAQPLIADALSGRGLIISSRPPWRADLVDEIDLSGPLPAGWEAELWHEDRLVAVTRTADAAGNWRFTDLPVRLGENRWKVRLYGPHGEFSEQPFTRIVGSEMNAENEVDYAFGFIDGGTPLLGAAPTRVASGGAGFATMGWGVAPALTARLDLRAPLAGDPAMSLGLHGNHAGSLWAATMARDSRGGWGGALRLARRLGSQDVVIDLARHGRDDGPAQPPLVREFSELAGISGQGRLALGRLSLPWQVRLQSATRRSGGGQQAATMRVALPLADWQANAAVGLVRQGDGGWQGNAALGLTAAVDRWRLRAGVDAALAGQWRLAGATLSAARSTDKGAISLDLAWQAATRRLGGGISVNRRFGSFGLSAGVARANDGWRLGLGLVVGLWQGAGRWHTAPAGLARSGAVMADMFIDDDGDGQHDASEAGVAGGSFIVGNTLRSERTGADGHTLLRGLPAGPMVDVETQLASLPDFTLRPVRAGDRLSLRPGEVRELAVPLQPTGSIEARVLLAAGDTRTPRSGVPVVLRDATGKEVARSVTDFEGYVLFEGLKLGSWQIEAGGQTAVPLTLSRSEPDKRATILVPPAAP
jgi:hypothetical protein